MSSNLMNTNIIKNTKIDENKYIILIELDPKISKEDLRQKFKECGEIK